MNKSQNNKLARLREALLRLQHEKENEQYEADSEFRATVRRLAEGTIIRHSASRPTNKVGGAGKLPAEELNELIEFAIRTYKATTGQQPKGANTGRPAISDVVARSLKGSKLKRAKEKN